MSVFPSSLFRYFSNQGSAESIQIQGYGKLTCSSLFYLLCRYSKDIEYFNHYLHDDVRHCRRWWDLGTGLEAFEKVLDPLKDVDEDLLGCTNVLTRLRSFSVKFGGCKEISRKIQTWRRTPTPASSLLKYSPKCALPD